MLVLASLVFFLWPKHAQAPQDMIAQQNTVVATSNEAPLTRSGIQPTQQEKLSIKTKDTPVPFTSQAPLREWSDKRQQDGCEEATSLMAVLWARGVVSLTPERAKKEILSAYEYEVSHFGNGLDTNAQDTTTKILSGYFAFPTARVQYRVTIEDIIQEIMKGNIVVTPMNGQALHNPFFTPPGPERHMVLIRGYDAKAHEFITNDPGTIHGEGYRYSETLFFNAIREYESGDHAPVLGTKKTMIVVTR